MVLYPTSFGLFCPPSLTPPLFLLRLGKDAWSIVKRLRRHAATGMVSGPNVLGLETETRMFVVERILEHGASGK